MLGLVLLPVTRSPQVLYNECCQLLCTYDADGHDLSEACHRSKDQVCFSALLATLCFRAAHQ